MRPGQLTPENVDDRARERREAAASMRPGQLTPENIMHASYFSVESRMCFNEAGAINPGKQPEEYVQLRAKDELQ